MPGSVSVPRVSRTWSLLKSQTIGLAFLDEFDGPIVELLEVVGCVEEPVAEIAAQPFHILDDRIDVLCLFLRGIGVVEAQVALAAELLGEAEVEHDALGVADVQVAIGFRRKARVNTSAMFAARSVGENQVANEIRTGVNRRRSLNNS